VPMSRRHAQAFVHQPIRYLSCVTGRCSAGADDSPATVTVLTASKVCIMLDMAAVPRLPYVSVEQGWRDRASVRVVSVHMGIPMHEVKRRYAALSASVRAERQDGHSRASYHIARRSAGVGYALSLGRDGITEGGSVNPVYAAIVDHETVPRPQRCSGNDFTLRHMAEEATGPTDVLPRKRRSKTKMGIEDM